MPFILSNEENISHFFYKFFLSYANDKHEYREIGTNREKKVLEEKKRKNKSTTNFVTEFL